MPRVRLPASQRRAHAPHSCTHSARLSRYNNHIPSRHAKNVTDMPLRVSNLRLGIDEPEAELAHRLAKLLGLRPDNLRPWRILRKRLAARDEDALSLVSH